MLHINEITSTQNEKIKNVLALSEKSKLRKSQEIFIVEGLRELFHCIKMGYQIEQIYFNPKITPIETIEDIIDRIDVSHLPRVYAVAPHVYAKIAYRDTTEGVIAIFKQKSHSLKDIVLHRDKSPFVLIVESVEKPGNLGALLRTADACGVDAVLVCDQLTDLYNPNLIRASIGAIFTKQVAVCSNEEAYEWLKSQNIKIFTAQLQDSNWYYNVDMVQSCAIVMGSEAEGLSNFWREVSDAKVKIPMLGELDSLNVSVSAAVLCYEAVRQRESAK